MAKKYEYVKSLRLAGYLNHSWIEFDIDNSVVRNAENKNGISYEFGSLRMITQSVK